MKHCIILLLVLLSIFSTGCFTQKQQSSFFEGPLVTTKIWVDYDELFKLEKKSMFFLKLNDIVNKQHPDSNIRIFVDSQLLPSLVVDGKKNDIFSSLDDKKKISGEAPKFSNDQLVTLMDVLKVYCDMTITCWEYRDSTIFIVPNKK